MKLQFEPMTLRVVLKQEGTWWVAVCLDYFIATQGRTPHDARQSLLKIVGLNIAESVINQEKPFENKEPAPPDLQAFWTKGVENQYLDIKMLEEVTTETHIRIEGEYRPRLMN